MILSKEESNRWRLPLFTLIFFTLQVSFIQPLREGSIDDDWAYVWTVKNYLDTGQYRLHDWLSANMPFQMFWGLAFSKLFGFSFSILRVSTLALVLIGIFAFFKLAKEFGIPHRQADFLTAVLISSPLVIKFGFSFMTDVPFLMTLIVALLFYVKALRLQSWRWMIAASIAASACILVRQFGLALVAGLLTLWAIDSQARRKSALIATGLILPVAAVIWQINAGMATPNWAAQATKVAQSAYLHNLKELVTGAIIRPGIVLQYLALFTLPLVLVAFITSFIDQARKFPVLRKIASFSALAVAISGIALMIAALAWIFISPTPGLDTTRLRAFVAGVFCIASSCWFFLILRNSSAQKFEMSDSGNTIKPFTYVLAIIYVSICPFLMGKHLMPYLPWSLVEITRWGYYSQIPVTLASCFGGILFLTYFLRRYTVGWWIAPMESKIIDLTSLFLLGAHLIFLKIGDEYLLDLLPLTILVVGKRLTTRIFQFPYGFVGGSLLIGLFWTNSTRANLSSTEAR